jgi:two-component system, OmpR family, phosphate regulon response regulator OmpR
MFRGWLVSKDISGNSIDMQNPTAETLLIIEDDARLRSLLERYLQEQAFTVFSAEDCKQADKQLQRHHVDAVILDLMLPGEDGLSWLRRIRAQDPQLPIIMLTARGDDIDRIIGLELGADDYLPKPANPRELLARIRAVLRRKQNVPGGAPQADLGSFHFGTCILDGNARTLSRKGHPVQRLTSGEFALLSIFVRHPNVPLSRDRILSLSQGREQEPFERSIDVTISRLRKLIEQDAKAPRHLQTVWGHGYVFVPDVTP